GMPESLQDQVVIVIGASSGIGRATAIMMAREGAKVMASARRQDRLDQLKKEMLDEGRDFDVFAADACDPEQMNQLAKAAMDKFGRVNILVYASGTNTKERTMQKLRPEIWRDLLSTNLDGPFYATAAVLPAMREARSGHLI